MRAARTALTATARRRSRDADVSRIVVVGPHASTTPEATLRKLGADVAIIGECEDILPQLAASTDDWSGIDSLCTWDDDTPVARGGTHVTDMAALPALRWPAASIRAPPSPSPPLRRGTSGTWGRDGDLARLPVPLQLLREGQLPQRLSQAAASGAARRSSTGCVAQGIEYVYFIDEIFLPNRELLKALAGPRREVRPADAYRPLEATRCSTCSARPAACRSRPASRASPKTDGTCSTRTAGSRPSEITERLIYAREARALRAGQSDRCAATTIPMPSSAGAKHLQRPRRLGEQAGAAVPLSRFARLHEAAGARPTIRPGNARSPITSIITTSSATSRTTVRCRSIASSAPHSIELPADMPTDPRRVLMTADTVGGVWTYALELARALSERNVSVVIATMGPLPSRRTAAGSGAASRTWSWSPASSRWSGWTTRGATSSARDSGCSNSRRASLRMSCT